MRNAATAWTGTYSKGCSKPKGTPAAVREPVTVLATAGIPVAAVSPATAGNIAKLL